MDSLSWRCFRLIFVDSIVDVLCCFILLVVEVLVALFYENDTFYHFFQR